MPKGIGYPAPAKGKSPKSVLKDMKEREVAGRKPPKKKAERPVGKRRQGK